MSRRKGYRIEGTGGDAPARPLLTGPATAGIRGARHPGGTIVRELSAAEFPVAEALWTDYHETKGDPQTDRIFAGFFREEAVSVARCRKHTDGFEVDAVFTPPVHRGHGYAHAVMWGLVEACGNDTLYMHSVKNLTGFYGQAGFVTIPGYRAAPVNPRAVCMGSRRDGRGRCCPHETTAGSMKSHFFMLCRNHTL